MYLFGSRFGSGEPKGEPGLFFHDSEFGEAPPHWSTDSGGGPADPLDPRSYGLPVADDQDGDDSLGVAYGLLAWSGDSLGAGR